jgi:hypothetical protein
VKTADTPEQEEQIDPRLATNAESALFNSRAPQNGSHLMLNSRVSCSLRERRISSRRAEDTLTCASITPHVCATAWATSWVETLPVTSSVMAPCTMLRPPFVKFTGTYARGSLR